MGVYSRLNRPIHIVDYDPNWPALFEQEKALILAALGDVQVQIEHFGSTSVPGLAAKPVIDISLEVPELEPARSYIPALEKLGYTYEPGYEEILPTRLFLWKGTPLVHTHHLSIEVPGTPVCDEHITFRDYLRANPEEARRYQELKRELAGQLGSNMEAYVRGKTVFVTACLEKAQAARKG